MIAQLLAMLRLVNISKKFKNEIALSNFSLQVKTGELAVLIGPAAAESPPCSKE